MKITKANITKTLKAAGLVQSTSSTTRIRGYRAATPGFEVSSRDSGFLVEYVPGWDDRGDVAKRNTQVAKYAAALAALGAAIEHTAHVDRVRVLP